ncbi:MAG: gamma-glutamyltransferase family protein [Dehalococcoidia bacterium]|jgi:gamma-glutamyltranspeptidase/glutathione hydrolase|nr:gamma-glutamyltransferase [Chloroflexota bacterium]MDP5877605.1 gamma-glutamyltransferase family protein [Dehalococcoidia bacterium]MDP6273180.1 gamma-glutamyltransferase family protein [Dehalococcoidia bacterium]MDP7159714.1 gamma-glutamyltransferase family protein [Dehalococcoidia bacterium]MDP7212826.1 gamma-glutamyltransferase family protein [Dehalococcoidia bacterium]|tara:strand:+ start:372 stop:2138 length:1767 start_codon:yes stop_codon:yes gene_type:complete
MTTSNKPTGITSYRPDLTGNTHAVSSGHHLATAVGFRILEQGGNAIDAGVATGIAINVVVADNTSFGGVAPIVIYDAEANRVSTISGLGRWPKSATLQHFLVDRGGDIPPGMERVIVPAAPDAWFTALSDHGTMTLEQAITPALELARDGFPVSRGVGRRIAAAYEGFKNWSSTVEVFAPEGRPIAVGERMVRSDLARTFERLLEAERDASGRGREAGIRAARDLFYTGEIGEEIVATVQAGGGFLTMDDMASFQVGKEAPETGTFTGPGGEFEVYTCGAWCQGPSFAAALQILNGHDLASMGHNSADYIHVVTEAVKLSFADRDAYYGDPDFVDVPIKGLLDPSYATERRSQIDLEVASPAMPAAGDPWRFEGRSAPADYDYQPPQPLAAGTEGDTSYACVVDGAGNMFSATPSDTIAFAPVIKGLGFAPSGRGTQSWLDPRHPSALAPGKRPRLTPNALLAFKNGRPWMPFGTPGGDAQVQTTLQFFLNQAVFEMTPQQAAEAPRFQSKSFPDSFWPHAYYPGRLDLEGRIDDDAAEELSRRGHLVNRLDDWARITGDVCGITRDPDGGTVTAASDLRADAYAMAR